MGKEYKCHDLTVNYRQGAIPQAVFADRRAVTDSPPAGRSTCPPLGKRGPRDSRSLAETSFTTSYDAHADDAHADVYDSCLPITAVRNLDLP